MDPLLPAQVLSWRPQVNREFEPKNKHLVENHKAFEKSQHYQRKITNSASVK